MTAYSKRSRRLALFGLLAAAAVLASPRVASAQSPPCPDYGFGGVSNPQSQTIAPGATATMSVGAFPFSGACADFYWYEGTSGDTSHLVFWGTGSSVYTTPPLTATQTYWVRAVYVPYPDTGHYYPANSATATITVTAPARIVTQPESQSITPGMTATMSVDAIGPSPQTYQWYVGASGNTSSPIGGADASSYTTPALSSTTDYWVRVSNPYGPADSDTATITIGLATIATQPESQVIASGSAATLSVAATGPGPLTYQWYLGTSGNTSSPIGGATASSYTTPPLTTATNYWVRVSNPYGPRDSDTAAITIGVAPSIATQPSGDTMCPGGTATISVAVTGTAPLTYRWYQGTSGDTTTMVGSGSSFTTPPLTTATNYWVRVSNAFGTVDSNTTTISMHSVSVTPGRAAFGRAGGSGSAAVAIFPECSWSASTSASWIALGATTTGQGDGTLTFSAQPNTTGVSRSAAITIMNGSQHSADQTVLVTESLTSGDFDGDGKADVAFFRPSDGGWNVLQSSTDNTTSVVYSWGLSTDVPQPGDYDGDGTTDPTVYRPSTGGWYFLKSSTNYTTSGRVYWGLSTDVPMPGDYDGDGKTDPAIYRPSTGLWAILKSSVSYGSATYLFWGLSTDQPIPGDYDGDGKVDPAVYRPSTGGWFVLKSSTSYGTSLRVSWGLSTDVPVPGDYDGDGKVDPAIFRPSTGLWAMLKSGASYGSATYLTLGVSGDVAVPADYDGDGKTDPAVFHPATGEWSILKPTQVDPAHLWTFDEASGAVAIDAGHPDAGHGVLGPDARRVAGRLGPGALQFDAYDPNGYVNMPASVVALGSSDFTISFWMIKAPDPTGFWGTLVGNRGSYLGHDDLVQFYADDSTITFEIDQEPNVGRRLRLDTGALSLTDGQWHKITGVRAGPTAWLYVDGVLQATGTAAEAVAGNVTNPWPFTVGVNDYERAHPELNCGCRFDDVRIYTRALSVSEVSSNAISTQYTPFSVSWGLSTDSPINRRP